LRPARTTFTAVVLAVTAAGVSASPAAAQTILVTPSSPHPGQKIHISVPGCGVGPTAHTAMSEAFTRDVTLYGKADTGDADPMIKKELKPGTYPITAFCGGTLTVHGQVVVTGKGGTQPEKPPVIVPNTPTTSSPVPPISASPAASSSKGGSGTGYWVLGAAVILAGGAGVFLLRKRG
jgi:hypothetical protein